MLDFITKSYRKKERYREKEPVDTKDCQKDETTAGGERK
jgi:hypothetical protein